MARAAFRNQLDPRRPLHSAVIRRVVLGSLIGVLSIATARGQDVSYGSPSRAGSAPAVPPTEVGPRQANASEVPNIPALPLEPGPAALTGSTEPEKQLISADHTVKAGEQFSKERVGFGTQVQVTGPSTVAKTFPDFQDQILAARAYYHRGRYDEAIACYRQVLLQDPGRIEARADLASALIAHGRYDLALDHSSITFPMTMCWPIAFAGTPS
ncbi:MAG: tetratricopeptide repeat protein [Isosphaeraceae bacterium]